MNASAPRHWRFWDRPFGYRFGSYAQVQFEPRDLWLGVFWRLERFRGASEAWDQGRPPGDRYSWPWTLHVYLCIVPMLPLHVSIMRKVPILNGSAHAAPLGGEPE